MRKTDVLAGGQGSRFETDSFVFQMQRRTMTTTTKDREERMDKNVMKGAKASLCREVLMHGKRHAYRVSADRFPRGMRGISFAWLIISSLICASIVLRSIADLYLISLAFSRLEAANYRAACDTHGIYIAVKHTMRYGAGKV